MYWEDDPKESATKVPDDVVDLVFSISCRALPVDHAYALCQALRAELPWFRDEHGVGLHLIHGAESGNGWYRPEAQGEGVLYLTRRTKLVLRLPRTRVEEVRALSGKTLDVDGHPLTIGEATERPLSGITTLYARYVVGDSQESEEQFLERAARELRMMGIRVRKMVAGKTHLLSTPQAPLMTRSLLLPDLAPHDALELQRRGLGIHRSMGCGLFIPHKSIQRTEQK